jgi:hypothetical protein
MDSSDEEQPLFQKNTLLTPSDHDGYDSEDDFGLSSMADHDQYDNLNIPSNMKDILRMGNHDMGTTNLQDDSDSDTDSSLYQSRPFQITVDINKLNIELAKNKFHNFPLMPGQEEQNETTTKKAKKPREKKKRRDKGKKNADILEARQQARSNNLDSLMKRFEQEASEESANEDEKIKKKKGRQTRKQKSNEPQFDENGELLIRSTELLDESSSEEETEKKLSKKQELEMYRENERLRRATKISLKPVYNIKSFDDLVRRQDEREEEYMRKMALAKKQSTTTPAASTKVDSSDDGSDIEIIGDPKKIAAALMSPERARIPVPNWSPVRHATTSLRNHNRSMLSRITNEGYAYRIKMEEQAKARGQYASATERARQLLQKEKDALLINQQINQHFEKNKQNQHDDEDEEDDEDYQEDEEDDGFMNEYSGSSEEEFAIEDVDDRKDAYKRKLGHKEEGEEEEEEDDDMATMAFKRWKGKKIKKSIFDDDDDDDDDEAELAKKKATSQKPVPKHSISNFFKAKVNTYICICIYAFNNRLTC